MIFFHYLFCHLPYVTIYFRGCAVLPVVITALKPQSGPAVMAEPDRGLLFVFQVVRVGRFRCDEGIERKLRTEAEAGDEAIEGGLPVDGCPGIDILDKSFLLLPRELIREEVLILSEYLHISLHLFILLEAASLRIDIAIVKLFDKVFQGCFSFDLVRNPCVHAVKM